MNFFATAVAVVVAGASIYAADGDTVMLSGASFGTSNNGWFEIACSTVAAVPINKAVGGHSIMSTAVSMYGGTFYTKEELRRTDALVIMHVHNQNVADTSLLKANYLDYTYNEIEENYPIAYDYVIRKYKDDCYNLRNDSLSAYFGTAQGRPAKILLCTHWHDSRTIYNPAIRKLAKKWGLPLIRLDDSIGFTKDVPDSGNVQPSIRYAEDFETIDGVVYGWHPRGGKTEYIQNKIASIAIPELQALLKGPSVRSNDARVHEQRIPEVILIGGRQSVRLPAQTAYTVSLYNLQGRVCYARNISATDSRIVSFGNLPAGTYQCAVAGDGMLGFCRVVVSR